MANWLDPYQKDPQTAWAVYEPSVDRPWNASAAAHLHRRAAFGTGPDRLADDARSSPADAVDRLLRGDAKSADAMPAAEFARFFDRAEARLGPDGPLRRIQALWLQRMVTTPHPALEALTLFWHDHFATSQVKVQNTGLMVNQIATLRMHAFGPFAAMLDAVARDPAMLVWLDAAANRRSKPNENFAREVMELFTLGRGNYTEKDIQEAARAYTGWFVIQDRFTFLASQHDAGEKTVLGKTGPFDGTDIHRVLLDQPASGLFLARKLVRYYVSETDNFDDRLLAPLAETFRASGGKTESLVRAILASRLFHDPAARRRRVKSPVASIVGTCRMLGMTDPMPPPELLADAASAMGQGLYAPPGVAGWDGGAAWIDTTRLVARTNFALGICSPSGPLAGKLNLESWANRAGAKTPAETTQALTDTLLADGADAALRARVQTQARAAPDEMKAVVARLLTEPAYQLA